tara:strand:- start:87 stop:1403 length:1317 start_codon:yes stop_codon:yes gene_type:complete
MALTRIGSVGLSTGININAGVGTFTGDLTVGGVLTYEDVTNVDSIGIITARAGVKVGSGITLSKDGDIFATGVTTATKFVGDGSELTGVASTENIRTNTNATFLQNVNVSGTSTVGGDVNIADKIVHIGDTNTAIRFPAADTFSVETAGNEATRINSNGRILVNSTTSRNIGGSATRLVQVEGTAGESGIAVVRNSANASPPTLDLAKSRSGSVGGNTIVQSGDKLGIINFVGADGTDLQTSAAQITGEVDGTPGADDMPGRLVFKTTADGSASTTERLRIDSSGRLLLGTTTEGADSGDDLTISNSGNMGLTLRSTDSNYCNIYFSDATSGTAEYAGYVSYQHSTDSLQFATASTERLRIDSSGHTLPGSNNSYNLGSSSTRWANVYTNDLHLSNQGSTNSVDNTWGDYTIQEGESDLFLINNRSGKKYKFNLTEVS